MSAYRTTDEVEEHHGALRSIDRRIVTLYLDAGLSARECGRELHLSASTVLRRLEALGVPRRGVGGSRPRLTERELRRAAFLYERLGLSISAVGAIEGVHPNAVRHRLIAAGIPLRRRGAAGR
jgi:transposase